MQWNDVVAQQLQAVKPTEINAALAARLLGMMDLTSLNETDTEASIAQLLESAQSPAGHVAAVCIYPAFVRLAATSLAASSVQVATVVNFPEGDDSLENVLVAIGRAIADGAQEIDVVFPYSRFLAGEQQYAHQFVVACKAACGAEAILKVILETGALVEPAIIADAAFIALQGGADFIKTSTGKISQGATPEAVAVMLLVIRHMLSQENHRMGIKISGGVRTVAQAAQYLELAEHIMGPGWAQPDTFRIGASKLLDEIKIYLE